MASAGLRPLGQVREPIGVRIIVITGQQYVSEVKYAQLKMVWQR